MPIAVQEYGRRYHNPAAPFGPIEVVHSARTSRSKQKKLAVARLQVKHWALTGSYVDPPYPEATMEPEHVDHLAKPADTKHVRRELKALREAEEGGFMNEILIHARLPKGNPYMPKKRPIIGIGRIGFLDERSKGAKKRRPHEWQHVVHFKELYVPETVPGLGGVSLRHAGVASCIIDAAIRSLDDDKPGALRLSPRFMPTIVNLVEEKYGAEPVLNKSVRGRYAGEDNVPLIYYRMPPVGDLRAELQARFPSDEDNYLKHSTVVKPGS